MNIYGVASGITNIENSPLVHGLGIMLGIGVVGVIAITLITHLIRPLQAHIMQALPWLAVAVIFGALMLGLLHSFHLW